MAEPLAMTATVRDFIRQAYAETAVSVQQVFAEDQLNATLQLAQVRICCGSEAINRVAGGYQLSEQTPWLAELCFGKAAAIQPGAANLSSIQASGSRKVGALPCSAIQGVGRGWATRLADEGISTVEALARMDPARTVVLAGQWRSRVVIAFFAKARVAMAPLPPIPRCALLSLAAGELFLRTPGQLSAESGVLDVAAATHLLHYLAGLSTALDATVLNALRLEHILAP